MKLADIYLYLNTKMENEVRKRKHKNKRNLNDVWAESFPEKENTCVAHGQIEQSALTDGLIKNSSDSEDLSKNDEITNSFTINLEIDMMSILLFFISLGTRMYKLVEPQNIVFDELHFGKYVSLYMKNIFFFDSHPPLGKQLISIAAHVAGYEGDFKFDRIGSAYSEGVPLFALRLVPAICGSMLAPVCYKILLQMGLSKWTAVIGGLLIICDNALLTQSRFILLESILLLFSLYGLLCILRFRNCSVYSVHWWIWLSLASASFTCALCVKYVGFFSCCLGALIVAVQFWRTLGNKMYSNKELISYFVVITSVSTAVFLTVYLCVFYVHLSMLYKAGPHDSVMTSAFQASLQGGLASITAGQPLKVSHGSQVTLRHTHGRTCWLHSHSHTYPIRYADKRGSSHQQQVTCYSFKDVNNWWIIKRPERNDLSVGEKVDPIKHNDIIQLVHGITSRALNSHDVAAPVTPQCQEVSCYIDYNISMPAQNLWRVEIVNRRDEGDEWHTIQSQVRLVHLNSSQALRFTGRQLPDWGFNQHEVVTDRIVNQPDTVWNVEEHRYTKSDNQKERERDLVNAEMIPTTNLELSFWRKLLELQTKMLFSSQDVQTHMYSSEPLQWPLLGRGIAYWVDSKSNAQIHLLGNILIWYSATISVFVYLSLLVFFLLRRRRLCYDLSCRSWEKFVFTGEIFLCGYLLHYLPYFFVERTLFLHHYLPAFSFKVLLLSAVIEHVHSILIEKGGRLLANLYKVCILLWLVAVVYVFFYFSVVSYGTTELTSEDVIKLRWKDTWDFILHKNLP